MEADGAAQPVHHKLEYSALIGLFTQACRTPAKFARSNISGDRTREGFSFVYFLCKKVSENKKNGIYRRKI